MLKINFGHLYVELMTLLVIETLCALVILLKIIWKLKLRKQDKYQHKKALGVSEGFFIYATATISLSGITVLFFRVIAFLEIVQTEVSTFCKPE
ncbi:hypothetical protein T190115A13A_120031 [Tenacibaculum sp. 190524A02b]|uniref:Uncharacterized protein n=1 Tax=Tenacibaculum vairaonense TaxID=3137860 RepID=A0ABM9PHF9_9FLAO